MKKVIDFMTYKIEKSLKEEGFIVKVDKNKKVKLLIKLSTEEIQ